MPQAQLRERAAGLAVAPQRQPHVGDDDRRSLACDRGQQARPVGADGGDLDALLLVEQAGDRLAHVRGRKSV